MTTLSRSDYTVGWICALPEEMAAAKLMMETIHTSLPSQPTDTNSYIFGNIGKHNIVIACLPSGVNGGISAAIVGLQLTSSFPSVRFCLLVGIGGGVPSRNVDIRLGDIVVGQPNDVFGGVIQYDLGKVFNGQFHRTGMLNRPPNILLTALSTLRAHHLTEDSRIPEFISNIQAKTPSKAANFARPNQEDRLFKAEYSHGASITCIECDQAQLIPRPLRDHDNPVYHYGLIASANQVVKDGKRRDQLAQEYGAYCVEMEAAGLMNNFPCLVIRGISDYADSHKNKEWQGYAAIAAAAYAKELLLMVPVNQIHSSLTEREKTMSHNQTLTAANVQRQATASYGNVLGSNQTQHQGNIEEHSVHDKDTSHLFAIDSMNQQFASNDMQRPSEATSRLNITEKGREPPIQLSREKSIHLEPIQNNCTETFGCGTLKGHSGLVTSVAFSPDGKTLGSGSLDKTVRLWNAVTGTQISILSGHSDRVDTVVFSPDGKLLASGSRDKTVRLWNAVTGTKLSVLGGHSDRVNTIVFSPDGSMVASGSLGGIVKLWNTDTRNIQREKNDLHSVLTAVAFSPNGEMVASGTVDGNLRLWNNSISVFQETGQILVYKASSMVFSPDGSVLAYEVGREIFLWDITACTVRATLNGHSQKINAIAFSPDGNLIASGSHDKTLRLWDTVTGAPILILSDHSDHVNAVAFSPDGKLVASGSDDQTIRLCSLSTGLTYTLNGYWGKNKNSVAFSPDGKVIAYPRGPKVVIQNAVIGGLT